MKKELTVNQIGTTGAEGLSGILGQCTALARLNLTYIRIGADEAECLAGVLAQCAGSPQSQPR